MTTITSTIAAIALTLAAALAVAGGTPGTGGVETQVQAYGSLTVNDLMRL